MKQKYFFVAWLMLIIMLAGVGMTGLYVSHTQNSRENSGFRVVTSFYPMYVAAKNIIGDCQGVSLVNLSEPQTGCMHDYQLTPKDMKELSGADIFVVNGGGIENFLADVAVQYPELAIVYACEGIELLDQNAHVWMSIADYMTQVQTIAKGLSRADESHSQEYAQNCTAYLKKLEHLLKQQKEAAKDACGREVMIFHEAFAYIVRDCGMQTAGTMDLDEERMVSAGEVQEVTGKIKEYGIQLIFAEERYGKKMCQTIQAETDVQAVYLDPCVRGSYEADSYVQAMEQNIKQIRQALTRGHQADSAQKSAN